MLEPALHGVHAGVQRLVAGGVGGIEDPGVAPRGVVGDPTALHRRQPARQPCAGDLAPGKKGGPLAEHLHHLSEGIAGHVDARTRRRRRRGLRRGPLRRGGIRRRAGSRGLRGRASGRPGARLARGLTAVENRWIAYNTARRNAGVLDAAHTARDQTLYAGVDSVERRFEQSGCPRP